MEHKKFFVKDFIQYASPCFGCNKPLSFYLWFKEKVDTETTTYGTTSIITTNKYVEVNLYIKYSSALRIRIFHKTNKFTTNDNLALANYLNKNNLRFAASCRCGTKYITQNLNFQISNEVVSPVILLYENVNVTSREIQYTLNSNFEGKGSTTAILTRSGSINEPKTLTFKMPLYPRYRLRNKQHLIDKLNTYAIFS